MKIDPNYLPGGAPLDPSQAHGSTKAPSSTSSPAPQAGPDTANLSLDQANVSGLRAQMASLPEVRSDRVAALRQSLADGTYHVDAGQVAHALFAELLDPGGKP